MTTDTQAPDDGTMPTEQPQVTNQTKFRRGGFRPAAEVIAEAAAAPVTVAEEPTADDFDMNAVIAADPNMNFEMPEGVAPLTGGGEPEEATEPAAKIKIGTREFDTQGEAWAYAEELERKQDTADAFRQGVELASQTQKGNLPEAPAAPEPPKEIDPEYYTNPEAYFAKRESAMIARAEAKVNEGIQRRQSHESTWNSFYSEYPDLGHVRELVDLTLQQNWNALQHIETKAALKMLADRTRAKLKPYAESVTPKVTLPRVTTTASPGGAAGVTPKTAPKQVLNFAQQLKQNKRSRGAIR